MKKFHLVFAIFFLIAIFFSAYGYVRMLRIGKKDLAYTLLFECFLAAVCLGIAIAHLITLKNKDK